MLKTNNILKDVVDKIDYNQFVELLNKHKEDYNIFLEDKTVFDFFCSEDLIFDIYINQNAEMTLSETEENYIFFTIKSNITTKNIFTNYFKADLSHNEFISKLKELVDQHKNNKLFKIKQYILTKECFNIDDIHSDEGNLIFLLDDDYLIKLTKTMDPLRANTYSNFISKYKNHIGPSYIIKFNNYIYVYHNFYYYFNNKKTLLHKDDDTIYFDEEKEKLFKYIEKNPNSLLPIKKYLVVIYGLYFKLFTKEELKIIVNLFDKNNQVYFYDNQKESDFNKEFVQSLFVKNNVDFKLKNIIFYDYDIKSCEEQLSFYSHKLKYLLYLINDLMTSEILIIKTEDLYFRIKKLLINYLDFLSNKSGYDKDILFKKIDSSLCYSEYIDIHQ